MRVVFWKAQLDVRDLGGHLHFTYRARAGTLSHRVVRAPVVSICLLASMLLKHLMSPRP